MRVPNFNFRRFIEIAAVAVSIGWGCAHAAELPTTAKGLVVLDSPVSLGWRDGPKYDYQGPMPWSKFGRVRRADAAVFHYTGPASEPAIRSGANGAVLSGLNLWRQEYSNERIVWDGSVGYRFANPASSTVIQNASLAGFDTAILFADSQHTEHFTLTNLHFHACRVCFRSEESQAVGHTFTGIYQSRECEAMFQFAAVGNGGGGNIDFRTIVMQVPAVMFDIEKSNENSCTFTATNIKIDGAQGEQMTGWKLIRHKKGPLNFTARGHIGDKAMPAADAIVTADPDGVDVQLFWRNRIWPRDFEHDGTQWKVRN